MRSASRSLRLWSSATWLLMAAALPLAAQARDTTPPRRVPCDSSVHAEVRRQGHFKDPNSAAFLALLHPGLGHYYVGEYHKGFQIEAVAVGSALLSMGALVAAGAHDLDYALGSSTTRPNDTFALVVAGTGLAVAAGTWIYGIIDAPRAARRQNLRRGR